VLIKPARRVSLQQQSRDRTHIASPSEAIGCRMLPIDLGLRTTTLLRHNRSEHRGVYVSAYVKARQDRLSRAWKTSQLKRQFGAVTRFLIAPFE
jgi:hypothetical protein